MIPEKLRRRRQNSSSGPRNFIVSSTSGAHSTATRASGKPNLSASIPTPVFTRNATNVATNAPQAKQNARYLTGSGS